MNKESEREWSVHMTTPLVDARLKAQTSCQPHSKVGAHFLKQNPLDKPPCSSRQKSYQGTGRTFACPVRHTTDFLTRLPSAACSLFLFFFLPKSPCVFLIPVDYSVNWNRTCFLPCRMNMFLVSREATWELCF